MLERRPHAEDLGIGLRVHEARETVVRGAAMHALYGMLASLSLIPHGAWNG